MLSNASTWFGIMLDCGRFGDIDRHIGRVMLGLKDMIGKERGA